MDFYISTSIPYVNGPPHIGFAMELIIADVLARNSRAKGQKTLFATGTDEHGGKIAEKAKDQGVSPKEFADQVSDQFRELAKILDISNDRFIRTTDELHESIAKKIWVALKDDIYKKKYVGWYCTGDEAFFTETTVKENNGICPAHNRPYEKIEEENYFFRLSKYNSQIKTAIDTNKLRIIPETRKNEILSLINEGLEDISISRPKEKIAWGIDVPDDQSQVMYVWFEALLNYITVLGYPDGDDFKEFWPANFQVIGKDILRFHAAIWPGILLALGLGLPETLYVHGHVYIDGQKMSKSLGNSIEPKEIVNKYGVDAFRYFILRHIPSYSDGDFSWQKFQDAYQNELGNELGNAVQRTAVMVDNYLNGEIELSSEISTSEAIDNYLKECRFDKALEEIWANVKTLNQYIDEQKPWVLAKQDDKENLRAVLNEQVRQLRSIGLQLSVFLPSTAEKINQIFGANKIKILEVTLFPRIDISNR